jgi:RNA polymerase sigma factor (sigma-70 family)
MDIGDGDLVRLARDGDTVAFRLLVERHQPMARARAAGLCPNPSDVDDIVQESFLQAFIALNRLRDPDRFAGWLGGIVLNVCRGLQRRAPVTLMADWPEPVHPAAADSLPSADDLDRADALRTAMADLPAGQRRAVVLHYYADMPPGQIAESAGAARASLHKARLRLRAYITEHRPDLVPSGRTHMTTVRIARAENLFPPGQPQPIRAFTHVIVLADEAGRRELPVWLPGFDGDRLAWLLDRPAGSPAQAEAATAQNGDELNGPLLHAVGASVTWVDIDELGPDVTAARIGLTGPAGTRHVTARLADGLAVAITTGAPIRVSDAVMDRLAAAAPEPATVPATAPATGAGAAAALEAAVARHGRPRYEPRNLDFSAGLDGWLFGGSFDMHASQSHWHDYSCVAEHGIAAVSSAVPKPEGFALLRQAMFADDYRGATVVFRGEFRVTDAPRRAGLFLRVNTDPRRDIRGPLTEGAALADPDNTIVAIGADRDWTRHEVTMRVPDDGDIVAFGIFLAGHGRIELRDAELVRGT